MTRPRTVRERLVAENEYVRAYLNDVSWPDGSEGTYLRVVEPGGGAVILVADGSGRILLRHHYRYGVDRLCWEAPRGYGDHDEAAAQTALRELAEEAGLGAVQPPELLGHVDPNSSILASQIPVFLVERPVPIDGPSDTREAAEDLRWFTRAELRSLIAEGGLTDGFTLAALALRELSRT